FCDLARSLLRFIELALAKSLPPGNNQGRLTNRVTLLNNRNGIIRSRVIDETPWLNRIPVSEERYGNVSPEGQHGEPTAISEGDGVFPGRERQDGQDRGPQRPLRSQTRCRRQGQGTERRGGRQHRRRSPGAPGGAPARPDQEAPRGNAPAAGE